MGLKFSKKKLQGLGWDLLTVIGAAVFVYGLGLAWRPLGFIVGGLLVAGGSFFQGYWAARRRE